MGSKIDMWSETRKIQIKEWFEQYPHSEYALVLFKLYKQN